MKPIISIIIATFNAAKTLRKCLDSVVVQKNKSVELLVIDGGSSDGTQVILASYSSHIAYSVSEPDNGIYDAWNKGIAKSNGEWILFIGADDTLEIDAIEKYVIFLNKNITGDIDYICAKNTYIGANERVLKVFGIPWRWAKFRRAMDVAHVASLHSRKLFQEVGLYDPRFRISGDYELLLRKRGNLRCLFIDTCIARMAIGGASYSMRALSEAHQIRKLHSEIPGIILIIIYMWQVFLFTRHRLIN